jgi:hypothetical protein
MAESGVPPLLPPESAADSSATKPPTGDAAASDSIVSKLWSWTVVGTVVVLLIGGGVNFTTSGHPWIADWFYAAGAALFLAKFLTWEEAKQQDAKKRRKFVLIGVVLTTVLVLGAAFGNHRINAGPTDGLSLACDMILLPVSYHGDIWMLDTIFLKGLGKLSANPLKPDGLWPEDTPGDLGYRCVVTNYGNAAVYGVTIQFDAAVRAMVQNKDGTRHGGSVIIKKAAPIVLVPKPLGPQESFTFYICGSYDPTAFIEISPPKTAMIDGGDGRVNKQILLKVSSTVGIPMGLFPLKERSK